MVIVTTAVYRGLNSPLPPEGMTDPLNLPAPGRRQSVYKDSLDRFGILYLTTSVGLGYGRLTA